jgi:large subunit ribosomal protein L32e
MTEKDNKTKVKKTETKKETSSKPKKETTKKTETKKVEIKKKFIAKEKKNNKEKSSEAKNNQKLLEEKKKLPTFRGRFGKKNIRKKSNKKWQKWRKPRSIDLDRGLQHGFRPKIGYRNKKELRDIHPSGYIEVRVENLEDLKKVDKKINAVRIGANVGKRKRNEIIKEAVKEKMWVLN